MAIDAYNGTPLWQVEIPDYLRFGFSRDSGNLALADDLLYVAAGSKCLALDVQTGQKKATFSLPKSRQPLEWGYIAVVGDTLFGSAMKPGSAYRAQTKEGVDAVYTDFLVCSVGLFAADRHTGKILWIYAGKKGTVINPAIAAGKGDLLYFIESADPETLKSDNGRINVATLVAKGADLVALNAADGREAWRQQPDLKALKHALYLSYANDTVVVTGTHSANNAAKYELWAFNAPDGQPLWHVTEDDNVRMTGHGEQEQHPAIVGNIVYTDPRAFDLRTGKQVQGWQWQSGGHTCGTISTSVNCVFNRGGQPVVTDLATGQQKRLTEVTRPGCWISIIPAGGLVLIPETSSGCGCAYAIQTSITLTPETH
jgi:outer membrane protein assembly factor BamB